MPTATCAAAGQNAGFIPRSDGYSETNGVKLMQGRLGYCKGLGLAGAELRKCIAPKADHTNWDRERLPGPAN